MLNEVQKMLIDMFEKNLKSIKKGIKKTNIGNEKQQKSINVKLDNVLDVFKEILEE